MQGYIVVITSNGSLGGRYPLTSTECLFGQSPSCDVRVHVANVARKHCLINALPNERAFIRNLSPSNTTLVNGIQIGATQYELQHADVITVGDRHFRWEYPMSSRLKTEAEPTNMSDTVNEVEGEQGPVAATMSPSAVSARHSTQEDITPASGRSSSDSLDELLQQPLPSINTDEQILLKLLSRASLGATEIRCQEQSKGGIKYDVILADPAGTPPQPKRNVSPSRTKSVENIEEKLKAAEERRLSLEAKKKEVIAANLSKIEEVFKKKEEKIKEFITQTKEALEKKLETITEKRETRLSDMKSKLKDHHETVEKARLHLEQQTLEVRKEVEDKLQHDSNLLDEMLKNIANRFKEHEEQVMKVRAANQERISQLESQLQLKTKEAEERRLTKEKEQLEKLREQERRAEVVRQNKKLSLTQEEQNTASSG